MKKILSIILSFIFLFVITGCLNESEEELGEGSFYSLTTAYNVGFISKRDLLNIESSYSKGDDNLHLLKDDVKDKIIETTVNDIRSIYDTGKYKLFPDATEDDIFIRGFYGRYKDCYAVLLETSLWDYPSVVTTSTIDGVTFTYPNNNHIVIYKANKPKQEDEAKEAFIEKVISGYRDDGHIDEVKIYHFVGIFDDSYVAVILDKFNSLFVEVMVPLTVNGLDFGHSYGYIMYVYNNGRLYILSEAFAEGVITEKQLKQIHEAYHRR